MKFLLKESPLYAEVHPNSKTVADLLHIGSATVLLWKGKCGHEWEATVSNRTSGRGCPYCSNKKVLVGFNDLATLNPELAAQWHPTKNFSHPENVTAGSGKRVWWQCEKGHEWETRIVNRSKSGSNCPYCSHSRLLPGFNDLASVNPALAAQWHPTKNEPLFPHQVSPRVNLLIWWMCNEGHEWEARIASRKNLAKGCPYCSKHKAVEGVTDLATKNPPLASQWHPTKNNLLKPESVREKSNKKVWWLGECGHEWEAIVANRTRGQNCPFCSGQRQLPGFNDLATTHPQIAAQWHPTKNSDITPSSVQRGSRFRASWLGECRHEWEATVNDRTNYLTGCPECYKKFRRSQAELDIRNLLETLGVELESSNRSVLLKQELDIYLPSHRVAIEFNGVYWHSEAAGKTRTYHYDKWLACKELGIQLIQIWEDDWNRNPELVKHMLSHKLNIQALEKAYARKLEMIPLTTKECSSFLKQHHIQGFASGSHYLGLKNKTGSLVAAMVLKKDPDNNALNIVRYATSAQVQGGFTKLLKYAERTYKPTKFVTFSDNTVSDGGLYEKNGFTATKQLPPDYMYVVRGERKHKFGYRLKKFKNDPDLLWEEGLTERELALLNNLPRIWDAGKTKWEKVV